MEETVPKDNFLYHDALVKDSELIPPTSINAMDYAEFGEFESLELGSSQNVITLSLLLAIALITNLSAFPVILFRRTRYIIALIKPFISLIVS